MRRIPIMFAAALLFALILSVQTWAAITPVSTSEAAAWARYLVPLPRTLSITAKNRIDPYTVAIYVPASPDTVTTQARKELWESMGLPGTRTNPSTPAFSITLQIGGTESTPLNALKNSEQAYRILVESGNSGLRIVALTSRGLYYGVKTVQQLIAGHGTAGGVDIPILTVTDYPELKDRGLWGNDSYLKTRWMADRKMNYQEQIAARWFDSGCIGHAGAKSGHQVLYQEGPLYGLEPCYAVLHLEQVYSGTTLFTCYPIVQGVSAATGVWCYSRPYGQPTAVDVLAWWMADLKNLPGCTGASVWMSESVSSTAGCKCSYCSPINRSVLEARTIVAGWKKAKQTAGDMSLRIMTTEATRSDNGAIVSELASDPTVKIWHYDSLKTYMVSEMQVVDSNIASWAASGKYAGFVPLLGATAAYWQPWTGPQFVRYRMQEAKNKSLSGLMGYPTPGIAHNRFNTEAAAEWSWNPDGRSVREFAASWVVRQGLEIDPEMFADWCDLMGPVSWDVYGSEFPRGIKRNNARCGPIATALVNNTLQPLGTFKSGLFPAPWGDIKTLTQLNDDVTNATRALALAKEMCNLEFYYESLVVHGYITALRALYELKSLVVSGQVAPENRPLASSYFYMYVSGMRQAKDALPKWATAIGGSTSAVTDSVALLDTEISEMTTLATNLGCSIGTVFTLAPVTSIPEAKKTANGTHVTLASSVITSTTNGSYIQESWGAPAGIRIQTSLPLTLGAPAMVFGTLGTANGERHVSVTAALTRSADQVRPHAVRTSQLGGGAFGLQGGVLEFLPSGSLRITRGLNNVGLLVKIAGRVTAVGSDHFYVDDGDGCLDGSGNVGVRVNCGTIAKPGYQSFVVVTGVSSLYRDASNRPLRAVVVTSASSIQPI